MSIEKGLSTGCTPAECYVHKWTCKDSVKKGDNNFTYHRRNLAIPMTVAHSSLIVLSLSNQYKRQFNDIPAPWRII